MKTTARIIALLLTVALVALYPSASRADEQPTDLYAFAVQGDDECAGYVNINYARGVYWELDGMPVEVVAPSSQFEFPGGFQGDVTAHALPGYSIPENVQSSFFLTVNPSAGERCLTGGEQSEGACVPDRRVEALVDRLDRKNARIESLREKVARLRDRLQR